MKRFLRLTQDGAQLVEWRIFVMPRRVRYQVRRWGMCVAGYFGKELASGCREGGCRIGEYRETSFSRDCGTCIAASCGPNGGRRSSQIGSQ